MNKDYINGIIVGLLSSGLIKNSPTPPPPPPPASDYHEYDTPIELYNGQLVIDDSPLGVPAGAVLFDLSSIKNSCKMSLSLTDSNNVTTTYINDTVDHPLLTVTENSYLLGKYELYFTFAGVSTSYSSDFPFVGIITEDLSDLGGPSQPGMLFVPNIEALFPEQGTIPNGTYTLNIQLLGDYEVTGSVFPEANYEVADNELSGHFTDTLLNEADVVSITGDMYNDNFVVINPIDSQDITYRMVQNNDCIGYNSFTDFDDSTKTRFVLTNVEYQGTILDGLTYYTDNNVDMLENILFNIKKVENPTSAWLIYPGVVGIKTWIDYYANTPGIYEWKVNVSSDTTVNPATNLKDLIDSCSGIEVILNTIDNNPENDEIFTIMKSDLGGANSITFEYTMDNQVTNFIGYDLVFLPVLGITKQDLIDGGYATQEQLDCLEDKCSILIQRDNGKSIFTVEIPNMTMQGQLFRFGLKLIF